MTGGPAGTYGQQLLVALRRREVPSARIAEALAEVDAHLAETGEDPVSAFGPPDAYARELAGALGVGSWSSRSTAAAVACGIGGALLADGLFALGAGRSAVLGLPAWLATVLGLALLAAGVVEVVRQDRRAGGSRVTDPRTGVDLRPPMPWWARTAVIGVPLAGLLLSLGLGLLLR